MYRRHILATGLAIAGALAGCAGDDDTGDTDQTDDNGAAAQAGGNEETDQTDDATSELAGVETYSGEWSGSIAAESYSGVWQFEADFDEGRVKGRFEGDGAGDITGTVSGGEIDAQGSGSAAFGTVEWSGEFSSNGQEVSGSWELAEEDIPGEGTWRGSVGKLPERTADTPRETETEEAPPQSDVRGSDIEDVPRYPDSVRTEHVRQETDTKIQVGITYIAEATFEEAFDFYDGALPENGWTIQEQMQTNDMGGFDAVKGSKVVKIVWESNSEYEGHLDIEIGYVEQK